jgi:hypothetical protein
MLDRSGRRSASWSARPTGLSGSRPRSRTASWCARTATVATLPGAYGLGGWTRTGGPRAAPVLSGEEPALSPRLPTDCALHRLRRDRSSGPGLRPRGPEACWRCPTGRQGARHRLSGTGDCAVRGAVRKLPQATDYRRAGALPQSSCCAPVAQRLELAPFKRKVGGSSPPGGTRRCDAAARAAPGRRCPASPRAPLPADRGSGCSGRPRGGRAVGGGLRGGF